MSYKIMSKKKYNKLLIFSIFFGCLFIFFQYIEYCESIFSISDSVFRNCFFVYTSFHGLHVIIGLRRLLLVLFYSIIIISSWYWHFVDIIWLFLFFLIYIWNINF